MVTFEKPFGKRLLTLFSDLAKESEMANECELA